MALFWLLGAKNKNLQNDSKIVYAFINHDHVFHIWRIILVYYNLGVIFVVLSILLYQL